MELHDKVRGAAVRASITLWRKQGMFQKQDARSYAEDLMRAAPPFPPELGGTPRRWETFGDGWIQSWLPGVLAAIQVPMALDPGCLSSLARQVLHASWEVEEATRATNRILGTPESRLVQMGAGWVSPLGETLACGRLGHLAALRSLGMFAGLFEEMDDIRIQMKESQDDFTSSFQDKDEHTPWHAYSLVKGEYEDKLSKATQAFVNDIYRQGWVRLSLTTLPGERHRTMSAEGSYKGISSLSERLERIADLCDSVLVTRGRNLAPEVVRSPTM